MLLFLVDITLYCGVVRSNICVSAGEILIFVTFINTSHRVIVWNLLVMVKITAEHWVKFVYFDLHASQKPHEGMCLLLRCSSRYCLQSKVEITNLECWILTRAVFRYLCIVMVCMVSCSREVLEEEERSPLACLSTEPITHTHTRLTMLTRPGLHRVNTDHQQCEPGLENSHQLVEEEHHTSYTHHTIQQQVTICHNTTYQNIFFKNIGSNIVKIACA